MNSQINKKRSSALVEERPDATIGDELTKYIKYDPMFTYIGFTLNLPRVKIFVSACASAQKKILKLVIASALSMMPKDFVTQYYITYELCKDNSYHCHGIIYYKTSVAKSHNFIDFMSDYSKCLEKVINKSLKRKNVVNNINPKYHSQYKRMYSIPFVLQLYDDPDKYHQWITYIHKDQPNKC